MKKIMIADDDSGILEVTKIILEDEGYKVETVDDGEKILQKAEQLKPDLILLDLWMPGVSGEDICVKLKKNKDTHQIPVVILSASMYTQKISTQAGADDFLYKPYEMDELLKVVNRNIK